MKPLSRPFAAILAGMLLDAHAFSQSYPARPVRMVVPFAAGGAVDTVARALGQKLVETWKQPMLVDNRPGAGGNIAADHVAKAPGDGYNLAHHDTRFRDQPRALQETSVRPARDFAPVTQLTSSFVGARDQSANSGRIGQGADSRSQDQARRDQLRLHGIGAPPHLLGELLKSMTGTDMLHVPYKGDAPLSQALLAGEVQLAFMPLAGVLPHIRSGRLRALGVSGTARSATLPEVPTLTEGAFHSSSRAGRCVCARRLGARHRDPDPARHCPGDPAQDMHERWTRGATNRSAARPSNSRKNSRQTSRSTPKVIRESGIPCRIDRDRAGAARGHRPSASFSTRASRIPAFLIWISITGAAFA